MGDEGSARSMAVAAGCLASLAHRVLVEEHLGGAVVQAATSGEGAVEHSSRVLVARLFATGVRTLPCAVMVAV